MENKNYIISTLRGSAIILVVYGHVIQRTMAVAGRDFFLNPAFKIVYTFHLPLFVFMSGYVMAYSLKRRGIFGAFKTRCKTLLVPFLTWGILDVLSFYSLDRIDGKDVSILRIPWGLLNALLLKPSVWFLFTLFVLSCMLLYSVKWAKRFGPAAFVLIYLVVLVMPFNDHGALFYIKWFYLFYMAGYFVNQYGVKITNGAVHAVVLGGSLVLFAVLVSYWMKTDYLYIHKMNLISKNYFYDYLRFNYRYGVSFLGIIVVFYIGTYLSKTKIQPALDAVGVYSLDIYLIQRYLVEGFYPRFIQNTPITFDFNSPFFLCLFAPVVTAGFVGVCLLISKLFIRKNYFLNTLLLGGRT